MPLPVLVADGRNPGELFVGGNATVFEFNPWEFGTFDPTVFGFVPLKYLGSQFDGGEIAEDGKCVNGFDNAGFVMGTSSSLFNQFILNLNSTNIPDVLKKQINKILGSIGKDDNDIAAYEPNPFYKFSPDSSPFSEQHSLSVVDGGEDLQNVPLHPLIQPERSVDVIFAVDSSADTEYSWPNGTALVATYERSQNASGISNHTAFPSIPDQNTFVNLGLNNKPTFFGCDSHNISGSAPLIVYLPNSPYMSFSNVSTFNLSYESTDRNKYIQNGYEVATMANGTRDKNWPACVGCAVLSRSFERTNTKVPEVCSKCFDTYCWNGTVQSNAPQDYAPNLVHEDDSMAPRLLNGAVFAVVSAVGATVVALL